MRFIFRTNTDNDFTELLVNNYISQLFLQHVNSDELVYFRRDMLLIGKKVYAHFNSIYEDKRIYGDVIIYERELLEFLQTVLKNYKQIPMAIFNEIDKRLFVKQAGKIYNLSIKEYDSVFNPVHLTQFIRNICENSNKFVELDEFCQKLVNNISTNLNKTSDDWYQYLVDFALSNGFIRIAEILYTRYNLSQMLGIDWIGVSELTDNSFINTDEPQNCDFVQHFPLDRKNKLSLEIFQKLAYEYVGDYSSFIKLADEYSISPTTIKFETEHHWDYLENKTLMSYTSGEFNLPSTFSLMLNLIEMTQKLPKQREIVEFLYTGFIDGKFALGDFVSDFIADHKNPLNLVDVCEALKKGDVIIRLVNFNKPLNDLLAGIRFLYNQEKPNSKHIPIRYKQKTLTIYYPISFPKPDKIEIEGINIVYKAVGEKLFFEKNCLIYLTDSSVFRKYNPFSYVENQLLSDILTKTFENNETIIKKQPITRSYIANSISNRENLLFGRIMLKFKDSKLIDFDEKVALSLNAGLNFLPNFYPVRNNLENVVNRNFHLDLDHVNNTSFVIYENGYKLIKSYESPYNIDKRFNTLNKQTVYDGKIAYTKAIEENRIIKANLKAIDSLLVDFDGYRQTNLWKHYFNVYKLKQKPNDLLIETVKYKKFGFNLSVYNDYESISNDLFKLLYVLDKASDKTGNTFKVYLSGFTELALKLKVEPKDVISNIEERLHNVFKKIKDDGYYSADVDFHKYKIRCTLDVSHFVDYFGLESNLGFYKNKVEYLFHIWYDAENNNTTSFNENRFLSAHLKTWLPVLQSKIFEPLEIKLPIIAKDIIIKADEKIDVEFVKEDNQS